jgi:hypothetical protein
VHVLAATVTSEPAMHKFCFDADPHRREIEITKARTTCGGDVETKISCTRESGEQKLLLHPQKFNVDRILCVSRVIFVDALGTL